MIEKKSKTQFRAEAKAKKQDAKELRALKRTLAKKVTSRRILKPHQATVVIPQQKVESPFDEPSRFFKREMEAAKKSMFF